MGARVGRGIVVAVAFVALVAFSAVLARLTLTPSPASAEIAGANLRPGHSLRQYVESYTFLGACRQIGGNLLLGAPFGLLLPVLVPRRMRMARVVLLTALVMVLVELAQGAIVEGRAFDIDDVILNTTGALLAYLIALTAYRTIGRRVGRRRARRAGARSRTRTRTRRARLSGLRHRLRLFRAAPKKRAAKD
ncbi:VanZ family protein [Streptomyces sp. NPDC056244]|uniref:VanZ family protein n=1 Tax=unclassified Streptomyces TaxID=2593676 RepID=UPI0035DEF0D1